jgi:YidC/Oxa1 family membrane protein insertase
MGEEKRFFLFLVLTTALLLFMPQLMQLIWGPPAPPAGPPVKQAVDKKDGDAPEGNEEAHGEKPGKNAEAAVAEKPEAAGDAPAAEQPPAPPAAPEPELDRRVLGSTDPDSGFRMQVSLTNRGAAVERIELAGFQSEDRAGPLRIVSAADKANASFLLGLEGNPNQLERRNWEIVPPADPDGDASVSFRIAIPDRGLRIIKTFTLPKDSYNLGLTIEIRNHTQQTKSVTYRLGGPHGFVLEGAWYANKFRDAVIGGGSGSDLERQTLRAVDLVKGADTQLKEFRAIFDKDGEISKENWPLNADWFPWFDLDGDKKLSREEAYAAAARLAGGEKNRWTTRTLRFAGVEGQYFCVLLVVPTPTSKDDRWDYATSPLLVMDNEQLVNLALGRKPEHADRSDVSVEIESRRLDVEPSEPLRHSYTIYAGPRQRDVVESALGDHALAQSLMNYRDVLYIPGSGSLVGFFASLMISLLQLFHGWVSNWGLAIIMLTVLVRLCLLPVSWKQTIAAQRMQQKMALIRPELEKLKEKYKNNTQEYSRAQFELMKKHGVDPRSQLAGCLPIFIQMPIFIGLWQGLSGSIDLRLARFVGWIDNLAAPDALFHWGENIWPISNILGPYFNVLPVVLIVLFLIQQKMFAPPQTNPADPQVEMQQKMMTYMMVFFGYIFYRLPSGLCVYYIASTAWGLVERKFLPKLQHATPSSTATAVADKDDSGRSGSNGPGRDGKGPSRPGKARSASGRNGRSWRDQLRARLAEILKQAEKR